jgi:CheY-like chemotaxis protein
MNGGAAAWKMRTGYHSGMVIAVVDDLMFASKIRGAAAHAGVAVTFVTSGGSVLPKVEEARPSLVIFDLDRESLDPLGAIRAIRASAALRDTRLVAFVRHTSVERIAEAREAGIDQVLARSGFFPALAGMLTPAGAPSAGSSDGPPAR